MLSHVTDVELVAACGLYCGACKRYLKEKCPGCRGNDKASWCKVRVCCRERSIRSCADCKEVDDLRRCRTVNNLPARVISLVMNSDRFACLQKIRDEGYESFAQYMTDHKLQTLPRSRSR